MHSRDEPSEPVEAAVPGCDSGRAEGTGSTTMSKSDTFQGPGGLRTPSAPGKSCPRPAPSENRDVTGKEEKHRRAGEEREATVCTAQVETQG